jgi:hypothetical protein
LGGRRITKLKLKTLLCLALIFTVFFAPFALYILPDSTAHAFTSRSGNNGSVSGQTNEDGTIGEFVIVQNNEEQGPGQVSVPEPATFLLFGGGLIGLFVLRRKLKK